MTLLSLKWRGESFFKRSSPLLAQEERRRDRITEVNRVEVYKESPFFPLRSYAIIKLT
jgi:hypothetical protein